MTFLQDNSRIKLCYTIMLFDGSTLQSNTLLHPCKVHVIGDVYAQCHLDATGRDALHRRQSAKKHRVRSEARRKTCSGRAAVSGLGQTRLCFFYVAMDADLGRHCPKLRQVVAQQCHSSLPRSIPAVPNRRTPRRYPVAASLQCLTVEYASTAHSNCPCCVQSTRSVLRGCGGGETPKIFRGPESVAKEFLGGCWWASKIGMTRGLL